MTDFILNKKDPVDFLQLSELCLDICNDKVVKIGEWSQRDIDLFCDQFKEADLDENIDMERFDPNFYPRSYFEKKFPGFDDVVIDALYECENKKLEDQRMAPLRVYRDKVGTLDIENPNTVYNALALQEDDKAEEAEEGKGKEDSAAKTEAEATADGYCTDRARWFQKANEEEED